VARGVAFIVYWPMSGIRRPPGREGGGRLRHPPAHAILAGSSVSRARTWKAACVAGRGEAPEKCAREAVHGR
jgi:hypothetical protein